VGIGFEVGVVERCGVACGEDLSVHGHVHVPINTSEHIV
jgi:hypothetical protein